MDGIHFFGLELFAGSLTGFMVSLLGWQVNLVSLHRGIAHGRRPAFFTGMFAALGDATVMTVVFSGALKITRDAEWGGWIKWVGVSVITVIAFKILFSKKKTESAVTATKAETSRGNFAGYLMVVTNPGVYLLWAGLLSFLLARFPALRDWPSFFLFIGGFLAGAAVWFIVLSRVLLGHVRSWQESTLAWISRGIGILMLGVAAGLAFGRF